MSCCKFGTRVTDEAATRSTEWRVECGLVNTVRLVSSANMQWYFYLADASHVWAKLKFSWKKRLQYFTWMCSLKGMFSTMQHVSLSQGRWHHFVKNVAMDIFLVFDCAFHSYFALQSFSNCKRPLKSVLLMTALFEYFLFIIWLIRYSQKLKFACNKWGERTPQCIYSSQKNYDITVVLFACHLTLHPLNGQYWLLGCSHTSWTCCQATELSPADIRKSMGRMAPR